MSERPVPTSEKDAAQIDHCELCGGVFLDFFDGDPGELCRGILERALQHSGGSHPTTTTLCPDCSIPMEPLRYLIDGPEISRCGGCMGLFATPSQLLTLAAYTEQEQPESTLDLLQRLSSFFSSSDDD